MKERIEVLLSAEQIDKRMAELADELYQEFGDEQVELVCALKGAVVTIVDLAKKMKMPVTMNFMSVSSYGNSTESSGNINIKMDLDADITGKNVLIVEDIIDTGRTLKKLKELLISRNPKKLKLVTLLDKTAAWWISRRTIQALRFPMPSWWGMVWIMPRNIEICLM